MVDPGTLRRSLRWTRARVHPLLRDAPRLLARHLQQSPGTLSTCPPRLRPDLSAPGHLDRIHRHESTALAITKERESKSAKQEAYEIDTTYHAPGVVGRHRVYRQPRRTPVLRPVGAFRSRHAY